MLFIEVFLLFSEEIHINSEEPQNQLPKANKITQNPPQNLKANNAFNRWTASNQG
jgi:hypothetical protein